MRVQTRLQVQWRVCLQRALLSTCPTTHHHKPRPMCSAEPIAMSRALFQLQGIVEGTDVDRSTDTSLFFFWNLVTFFVIYV